jgi:hypothetical protein
VLRVALALPLVAVATLVPGTPALLPGLVSRSGHAAHRKVRQWGRFHLASRGIEVSVPRPGSVEVRIHAPVATEERPPDGAEALAEEVRRVVPGGCGGAS